MTAALLMGGGPAGGVQQRRPSATLVLEMPTQQLPQNPQQQRPLECVPSSSALPKERSDDSPGEEHDGKTASGPSNLAQQSKQQQKQNNRTTGDDLPVKVWQRIGLMATPLDRIRIGQCSKRMSEAMGSTKWEDVVALEIRPIVAAETAAPTADTNSGKAMPSSASVSPVPRPSVSTLSSSVSFRAGGSKSAAKNTEGSSGGKAFRVQMALADGRVFRLRTDESAADAEKLLRTLLERIDGKGLHELTIWNGCLSDRFRGVLNRCCAPALRTLRLWNCSRYLSDFASSGRRRRPLASLRPRRPLLSALLALPQLRQLFILDTLTPEGASSLFAGNAHKFPAFSESLAKKIKAPLEEFQLTACRLPLSALRQLRLRCALSLRRLAIGCVWGSEAKREFYLRELGQFRALADLDLPPFLFCLVDHHQPDRQMQQLFDQLTCLKAVGFRHFKSSVLFRFIELHLPDRITALRVHHSVHRMPNFAQLGHPTPLPSLSTPSSTFASAHVPTLPRLAQSVRSALTLFGNGTAGGSPDSQRGPLSYQQQKKGSVVSQPSASLLSSSHSSVRSADSFSSAAVCRRSSVSLRSVTAASSSNASVLPLRRPLRPPPAPSTVTTATTVSSPFSSSTVTYSSPSSSTSSLGGFDSPFSAMASPTVGQYRAKSFSLGGEVCGDGGTELNTATKCQAIKGNAMHASSTWCASSAALCSMPCRKGSECVPQQRQKPPRQCLRHPSPIGTGESDNGTLSAQQRLARRQLTIVAVAEERIGDGDIKKGGKGRKTHGGDRLREQWHFGIRIIYVPPSEARHSQEVLGRMGSPIEAPFIYYFNKNCAVNGSTNREQVRLVDGDFVCPRPLSEFGTESDYENEEEEEE